MTMTIVELASNLKGGWCSRVPCHGELRKLEKLCTWLHSGLDTQPEAAYFATLTYILNR